MVSREFFSHICLLFDIVMFCVLLPGYKKSRSTDICKPGFCSKAVVRISLCTLKTVELLICVQLLRFRKFLYPNKFSKYRLHNNSK